MAFDLAGLTAYTNENKLPLIRRALLDGKTISMINVQPDIKSSAPINILETSPVWQAGACGWNASGTVTLTQRQIAVAKIKNNDAVCVDDLEAFYTQSLMNSGSYNEDMPFEQLYSENLADKTAKYLEQLAWQGDTAGAGSLALADGLIKIIDAEASVVTGTALALDAANVIDAIDEMVAATPEDVLTSTDLTLFVGHDVFRTYTNALKQANLYHVDTKEATNWEIMVHGTNVKVVAVAGLNGTDRIFLAEASNLYMGTDMLNDAEQFSIRYSEDNDEVRITQKMKVGFQIAFPERIVSN